MCTALLSPTQALTVWWDQRGGEDRQKVEKGQFHFKQSDITAKFRNV